MYRRNQYSVRRYFGRKTRDGLKSYSTCRNWLNIKLFPTKSLPCGCRTNSLQLLVSRDRVFEQGAVRKKCNSIQRYDIPEEVIRKSGLRIQNAGSSLYTACLCVIRRVRKLRGIYFLKKIVCTRVKNKKIYVYTFSKVVQARILFHSL